MLLVDNVFDHGLVRQILKIEKSAKSIERIESRIKEQTRNRGPSLAEMKRELEAARARVSVAKAEYARHEAEKLTFQPDPKSRQ